MEFFAILFALFMIAAAVLAAIMIGVVVGSFWGVLAFAALLWGLYKLATHQSGPDRPMTRDHLNAFQQPLAEDES